MITPETIQAVYGADVAVIAHPDTGAPQPLPAPPHRPRGDHLIRKELST